MGKLDQYCFDGTNALSLKKLPTDSKKDQVDKEKILCQNRKKSGKNFALQDKLYADAKEGLIIILQARDAAGKDSTIRHVMGGINRRVYKFSATSSLLRMSLRMIICGAALQIF